MTYFVPYALNLGNFINPTKILVLDPNEEKNSSKGC